MKSALPKRRVRLIAVVNNSQINAGTVKCQGTGRDQTLLNVADPGPAAGPQPGWERGSAFGKAAQGEFKRGFITKIQHDIVKGFGAGTH